MDDERESPSYFLMEMLSARGAKVAYYDPVRAGDPSHPRACPLGGHKVGGVESRNRCQVMTWFSSRPITPRVNYQELAEWAPCIVDTRNAMAGIATKPNQVWKA